MSRPKISDQLKSFESYINDIPLVIDPCRMCKVYKKNKGYEVTVKDKDGNYTDGRCPQCTWFYDSKFEVGK